MRQHSAMKPQVIDSACTGCELCIKWCPENAIQMQGEIAFITSKKCIGCGECLTVCRYNAIKYDWAVSNIDLQTKIAEHALGAIIGRERKSFFFNYILTVTKDCDCWGKKMDTVIPDIGVLASNDLVAIDQATLDIIHQKTGRPFNEFAFPHIKATYQLEHGVEIGLGKREYTLREL